MNWAVPLTRPLEDKKVAKRIGEQIRNARKDNDITQKELAKLMSLSVQQIQKYEHGETNISLFRLMKIAEVIQVSVLSLLQPAIGVYHNNHIKSENYPFNAIFAKDQENIELHKKIAKLDKCKKAALMTLL